MTLGSYNFKPKRTIYDGKDDDFNDYSEKISIPKLDCEIVFKNEDAKPLWGIHDDLKKQILKNISGIKVKTYSDDLSPSYKYNGLDICVYSSLFAGNIFHIVLAEGESQAARYKIILLGFVLTDCN
ncbi:hypothetical protein [Enterobacter ludwigii]|uniref:hypothetical protein n=1 Tax=Enterobacter ludwigii TaxID=299767 RepID=UPI003EF5A456